MSRMTILDGKTRTGHAYLAHDGRPQREEADCDDAEDDEGAADPVVPRRRVVQPHVRVLHELRARDEKLCSLASQFKPTK